MNDFSLFFQMGYEHILDKDAYDHMAFVVVLCARYQLEDWKRVLILITSFTIGHSITLALATLKIFSVNVQLVEFLIPLTILITGLANLFTTEKRTKKNKINGHYLLALFFGLIHGLGFSNYLQAILGKEANILWPLFAFNIGLEVGQIVIVVIFLLTALVFVSIFGVSRKDWKMVVSSIIIGIAFTLTMNAIYW